jgi:hypothetical protein
MEQLNLDMREDIQDMISDFILKNITVEVEVFKAQAYWDTSHIKVKLLMDGEVFSESTQYPEF